MPCTIALSLQRAAGRAAGRVKPEASRRCQGRAGSALHFMDQFAEAVSPRKDRPTLEKLMSELDPL